jgi:hypothetical protein
MWFVFPQLRAYLAADLRRPCGAVARMPSTGPWSRRRYPISTRAPALVAPGPPENNAAGELRRQIATHLAHLNDPLPPERLELRIGVTWRSNHRRLRHRAGASRPSPTERLI